MLELSHVDRSGHFFALYLWHLNCFLSSIAFRLKKVTTTQIGQTCSRAGTTEHLNERWWPPAARPRPLVSDWLAKLDLLSEQQWGTGLGDWKHPLRVMAVSGAGDDRNMACHSRPQQSQQRRARHVTHVPGRPRRTRWDSGTLQERLSLHSCLWFFANGLKSFGAILLCCWAGCRKWDRSTGLDSSSWILSKIHQDKVYWQKWYRSGLEIRFISTFYYMTTTLSSWKLFIKLYHSKNIADK